MKRRFEIIAVEYERMVQGVPSALPALLASLGSCPICQRATQWLTPAQVAQSLQVKAATVYRWLAAGKVHGLRTPGGRRRVCWQSLIAAPAGGKPVSPFIHKVGLEVRHEESV